MRSEALWAALLLALELSGVARERAPVSAAALRTPARGEAQTTQQGWGVSRDATVRLYVPAGQLVVRTWDRDSVHLSGTLHDNASLFGGGARTHVKVGVEARSQSDGTLPQATLAVMVPRRARLWVKMIDGTLDLAGTRVELEAYTVRGRLAVRDVAGTTTLESIDAPVHLTSATGDVRIRGSRATVTLERVSALASIATVSGAVVLRTSPIEGRIETVGGAISLDAVRAGGTLTAQTHAGDITLSFGETARPFVRAWARGRVVTGVDGTGQPSRGSIEARSFKGEIRLRSAR
jgi:hypothetical protein